MLDSYHRVRKDQAGLHAAFGFNACGEAGYIKRSEKELLEAAAGLIAVVRESTPLAHQVSRRRVAPRTILIPNPADYKYRGRKRLRQRDVGYGWIAYHGFRGTGGRRPEQGHLRVIDQLRVRSWFLQSRYQSLILPRLQYYQGSRWYARCRQSCEHQ